MKPQRAITIYWYPGAFFRTPQPRKLYVEGGDRSYCGFPWLRSWRGRWRRRHQSAAGPVIAAEDSAAARTLTAQLLRVFVEENIGVACHSAPLVLVQNEFLERGCQEKKLPRELEAAKSFGIQPLCRCAGASRCSSPCVVWL